VLKHDGKLYRFSHFDDGGISDSTRILDEEVECTEVEAYQEMVTKYRPVK
jgi:hypothetical protein